MRDTDVSTTLSVRVVYLARLREALGTSGETLTLAPDAPPTIESLVAALVRRGGHWAHELAAGRAVRFAVNHRLVNRAHAIADGDEVAIFPPVTGG
jgi:sulfur-carrier protein